MTDSYVALRAFRFGDTDLQPGDPVPVEPGRSYAIMLRTGQIAKASAAPSAESPDTHLIRLEKGNGAVFVDEQGQPELCTFLGVTQAPLEAAQGLGVEPGTPVAMVSFSSDPDNATLVSLDGLLPEQPTGRLIEDLTASAPPSPGESAHQPGTVVVQVQGDGSHTLLFFQGLADEPGLARVRPVSDDAAPETEVPLADLLPGVPATRLLAHEQARVAAASEMSVEATETAQKVADVRVQALQGQVNFLNLLVQAIRTEGPPLKAETPSLKDLQGNGLHTEEGLRLLAAGETGRANLIALDRIGEKSADKILAYLFPPTPEG